MAKELDERVLEDSYPVNWDYYYVVDGKVIRSDIRGTVFDLKVYLDAKEVRSCDIFGRRELQKASP